MQTIWSLYLAFNYVHYIILYPLINLQYINAFGCDIQGMYVAETLTNGKECTGPAASIHMGFYSAHPEAGPRKSESPKRKPRSK